MVGDESNDEESLFLGLGLLGWTLVLDGGGARSELGDNGDPPAAADDGGGDAAG